jgi:hypothetical protein
MNITNFYYKLRYKFFRKYLKQKKFEGTPDYQIDDNYIISEDAFYAGHSKTSKDCVEKKLDGLHLKVLPIYEYFDNWTGHGQCYWKIGWIEIKNEKFTPYGTWVWNVKLAKNSWCALWLLRKGYVPEQFQTSTKVTFISPKQLQLASVPKVLPKVYDSVYAYGKYIGRISKIIDINIYFKEDMPIAPDEITYGKEFIIPEVDIMELLTPKYVLGHTVHWGFHPTKYKLHSEEALRLKPDHYNDYEFAVEITPKKYIFYTNGIKTGVIKAGTSDQPLYPIMNNAAQPFNYTDTPTDFIIKDFKFYQNK